MRQPKLRKSYCKVISVWLYALIAAMVMLLSVQAANAAEEDWPREIVVPEGKIVMYQPQLESFKGDKLEGRAAVSVTKKGEKEPIFGAVWMSARVLTDRDTRMVTLQSVKMTNARFPNAGPEKIKKLGAILEREIPKWDLTISLDRLLTMLDLVEKEKIASENLKTTPPKIIFVTHPAALVTLDGDPELRKAENSKLMRVVNTSVFMVQEPSTKVYYLKGGNEWFQASDVKGQWNDVPTPPASVTELAAQESKQDPQDTAPTEPKPDRKPQIIVATEPTELIVSDGEPKYTPVKDTDLLYMSNTESDVVMEIGGQRYFILVSGRWFASASLDGPWSYVESDKLPDDFSKIPKGSEIGHVLASVAGTEESREAALDTHIPQTTAIKRDATISVTYDGKPKFEKIKGTAMDYAVNTGYSVIRFGGLYYCCHEAVWYVSDDSLGPWAVCVSVPKEIYTIPPDNPVYNVKYVHVYDSTPTVVYVGYTPGYVGTYVYGGTVVYGTGYYYHGWYGPTYYYYRPVTYGYAVAYTPYYGWGYGAGYYGGWYGGYRYGDATIQRSVTTPRGTWTSRTDIDDGDINRQRSFTPNENVYNRREKIQGNREGRQKEGGKLGTGAGRDKLGTGAGKEKLGTGAGRDKLGTGAGKDKLGTGAGRDKVGSQAGQKRPNNVFADRDGNIHRKTDQGWQKRDRSGWSDKSRSRYDRSSSASRDRSSSNRSRSDLNRHNQARQRGSQRTNNYRQSRSYGGSRGGFQRSGGGRRGGGGRRR